MKTKVKICGIRKKENAIAAVNAGADFLGFNFVLSSSRFIKPEHAKEIINTIKGKIQTVGVFMNHRLDYVTDICDFLDLDFVQLHGDETNEYCQRVSATVIKAISISNNFTVKETIEKMNKYDIDYFILDIPKGTDGTMMNYLPEAEEIAKAKKIFLSGKLNNTNVKEATDIVHPFTVDVARDIEQDGIEDIARIKEFIKTVKQ